MKNKIVTLTLMLICSMPFYGQKLTYGISAGLTVSTFSAPGNIYDNEALTTGFGGGLALHYQVKNALGLQTGIIYEQKGFRNKEELDNKEISGSFNYVTIPLMIEGSIPVKGNTRLYGITGAYSAFRTYNEYRYTASGEESFPGNRIPLINKIDAGLVFGGGVQIPAGDKFMQIGFRYSMGLAKVIDISPDDRNKSVAAGITLFF